ncbi:MAG TPA: hypothetical protein VFE45_17680, partial [Coriobacteriia bacterium]|nr:hypothetical protein [Coriobacteriia bacterium]
MRPSNRCSARLSAMVAVLSLALPLSAGAAVAQPGTSGPAAPAGVATVTGAPAPVTVVGSAITFTGHGWGHGRGMGQYGALGYALSGSPYADILAYYYGNTYASNVGNPEMSVELTALTGGRLVAIGNDLRVNGAAVGSGSLALRATLQANGAVLLETGPNCGGPFTSIGGSYTAGSLAITTADPSSTNSMIRVCEADGERVYRGRLTVENVGGTQMTFN